MSQTTEPPWAEEVSGLVEPYAWEYDAVEERWKAETIQVAFDGSQEDWSVSENTVTLTAGCLELMSDREVPGLTLLQVMLRLVMAVRGFDTAPAGDLVRLVGGAS